MLFTILLVLHILVCILLVVSILMQASKGGGLAGTFGGGGTFISGRQAADTLTKATVVLAVLFALLSVGLNITYLSGDSSEQGIIERQLNESGETPALPGQ